jgi:hypothetical protein
MPPPRFDRWHTGYAPPPPPPPPPIRVYAKNPGEKAAVYEVAAVTGREEAIKAVKREGFRSVMVRVK